MKIRERLQETQYLIEERQSQIAAFRSQYLDAKRTEKLNKYGIMADS
jgi:hypothetical protein